MNNNWSEPLVKLSQATQRAKELAAEGRFDDAMIYIKDCHDLANRVWDAMIAEKERRENLEKRA